MMTNNTAGHTEVYSLGVNERLAENHIETLAKKLENSKE